MNRFTLRLVALVAVLTGAFAGSAFASHSRYASIQWQPHVINNPDGSHTIQPNVIDFTVRSTWRRSYPGFPLNPVVGTLLNVGSFCFGDGGCVTMNVTVTSYSATEDWVDTVFTVTHGYAPQAPGTSRIYTAGIQNCCRLSNLSDANHDTNFNFLTTLKISQTPNSSPSSGTLPVINVPHNRMAAKFSVIASDPDNDPLTFSIAPLSASGLAIAAPPGLSINATTGVVTWDTRLVALNGLYAVQFQVADDNGAVVPVDVLLHPISATSTPPSMQIDGATSTKTFTVPVGQPVSFTATGVDPNLDPGTGTTNRFVSLTAAGVPVGAVLTPSLPVSLRSPASTTFTWTPGQTDVGNHTITFGATSDTGQQASNSVTIVVPQFNRAPTMTCAAPIQTTYGSTAPLTVTVADQDSDALTVTWTVDGTVVQTDSVAASAASSVVTLTGGFGNAGTHAVAVTAADGSLSASCSTTVTVNKADQSVSFDAIPDHYIGDTFPISATATSGLPVVFTVIAGPAHVSGNLVTVTAAGGVQIQAAQVGDTNYNPAALDRTFTVLPALDVTSITLETRQWNGHVPTSSADAVDTYFSLPLGQPGYAPGPRTLTVFDNVSNGGLFGGTTGNIGYHHHFAFHAPVDGTLSIRLGADFGGGGTLLVDGQVVEFRNNNMWWAGSYSDPTQYLKGTVQITAGPHVIDSYGFEDCCDGIQQAQYSYLGSPFRIFTAPANTVPVVTVAGPTTGTVDGSQSYTFTVADPDAGASFTNATVSCGAGGRQAGSTTTTATGGSFVCQFTAAGATTVTAQVTDNLGAMSNIASLGVDVAKIAQTITFAPLPDATYGDPDISLTATASSGLPVRFAGSGTCTVSGSTVHIFRAGPCAVSALQGGDSRYAAAPSVTRSFTIAKAAATIDVTPYSGVYDGQPHGVTGSARGVNGEDLGALLSPGGTFIAAPGGVAHWTFAGDVNYMAASGDAAVTIARKPASVTIDAATKVYGSADPAFTGVLAGFLDADGVTATYTRAAGEAVGSYAITAALAPSAVLANYDVTDNTAALEITRKPAIVTANSRTKTYGDVVTFAGTEFSTAGFIRGDAVATVTLTSAGAAATAGAGSYSIVPSGATGTGVGNYDITYAAGTLAVYRAALTVTADDQTTLFGAPLPALTVHYAGFVNGDTPAVLGGSLAFSTAATAASPVGTYVITPGGLTSPNYAIVFANGTLTVTYNVCSLSEAVAVKNGGSAIPIKLQLCDASRRTVSNGTLVVAAGVRPTGTQTVLPAQDAGNANAGGTFRVVGPQTSYMFNLQTKGYAAGSYELLFTVTGDPVTHSVAFQIR
jgi:hypothetical protein